jgi:hypothetical protein
MLVALPERLEQFHGHCLFLSLVGSAILTPRLATLPNLPQVENITRAAYSGYIAQIGREPGPMLDDYASLIGQEQVYVLEGVGILGG